MGTPVEMPVSTSTSERRKPVSPRASRLITTPAMIWSTRKVTARSASSSAMSPPVSRAIPTAAHSAQESWASPSFT